MSEPVEEVCDNLITTKDEKETNNILESEGQNSESNPYAYLEREEFSSEKFKISIKNLPKFYGVHVRMNNYVFLNLNILFTGG